MKTIQDDYIELLELELETRHESLPYHDKLASLFSCIRKSNNKEAVIDFLRNDKHFNARYGSSEALNMMRSDLIASTESALQDFLRWGIPGLIARGILQRFSRIRSICFKCLRASIDEDELDTWKARSLYLPSESTFFNDMELLANLRNAIYKFSKDPKADVKSVVDALRNAGIDVRYNGSVLEDLVSTDWGAVAGSFLGSLLGFGIPLPGLILAGNIAGGHVLSSKGGTLSQKGYTAESLKKAARLVIEAIDEFGKMKNSKPITSAQNDPEYAIKVRFIKKATNVYCHGLAEIGRGLAAAINHVVE